MLNNFILIDLNFNDFLDDLLSNNYLLLDGGYCHDLLLNCNYLHNFLHYLINNFVSNYNNWLFSSDLNVLGNLHSLLYNLLYFVHLRYLVHHLHDLLLHYCNLLEYFLNLRGCNWLLTVNFHLNNFITYVGHYLFYFLNFLVDYRLFLNFSNFFDSWNLFDGLYYLFNCNWNLYYFFCLFFDNNKFFNSLIASDWNLKRNDNCLLNLDYFLKLYSLSNHLLCYHFLGDLYPRLDNLLLHDIDWLDYFLLLDRRDNLLSHYLDLLVDWYLDILYYLHLHNLFLDYWQSHLIYYLHYLLYLHDPVHYFLDHLWHLHDLFHYPWHHHNLLHHFLHLHYLRYFHQFLNYLIDRDPHLFDPLNDLWNLNDLFHNYLDWLLHSNILKYWLLNL